MKWKNEIVLPAVQVGKVRDIKDDPRWRAEARLWGEEKATSRALDRVFRNEHYTLMREEDARSKEWSKYVKFVGVDDLIESARDLFEDIQNETSGVFRFVLNEPGQSWNIIGSDRLRTKLGLSSDVEIEIWRRVSDRKELPERYVTVFGRAIMPASLTKAFGEYGHARDYWNTTNGMPRVVESAFNHIPEVGRSFRVRGFRYPHPESKIVWGSGASSRGSDRTVCYA